MPKTSPPHPLLRFREAAMQTVSLRQSRALNDLKHAIKFLDKVKNATSDQQIAVRGDAWEGLERAARAVAREF